MTHDNRPTEHVPDPALRRLDFLVGTWALTGRFQSVPGGPVGEARGEASFSWLAGGFFLVHHWSGTFDVDGGHTIDAGYEFYDYIPGTRMYRAHFYTNLGGYDEVASKYLGEFDGTGLVLAGPVRTTRRPNPDGTLSYRIDLPAEAGQWVPWLRARLVRITSGLPWPGRRTDN